MSFVHCRVHSSYSLGRGASKVEDLFKRAAALGHPALAVTDTVALHAAMKAVKAGEKYGVQPIVGTKLWSPATTEAGPRGSLLVYARSEVGYANVCRLLHRVLDPHRPQGVGALDRATLNDIMAAKGTADDMTRDVALVVGIGGDSVGSAMFADPKTLPNKVFIYLKFLLGLFPLSFVEVCRTGFETPEQVAAEAQVVDWALSQGHPLLATTPVWYDEPSRHDAWAVVNAISDKSGELLVGDAEGLDITSPLRHHMRSTEEMSALFADLPSALANTAALAQLTPYWPSARSPMLPRFESESGLPEAEELRRQSREGLALRLDAMKADADTRKSYAERLEYELDVIERMKFPGYFLIVSDFIKWAKLQGIPVGPGRGSGAGSLVAYALVITDLDPIPFGLLFERFLNPERVSMPDFDIDFCEERRTEVISYVQKRYGSHRVGRISTFMEFRPKGALKDVARTVTHRDSGALPVHRVNQVIKFFPPAKQGKEPSMAEVVATEGVAEAIGSDTRFALAFSKATEIQGLLKTASTHAAGIVIGSDSLDRHIPVGYDDNNNLAVQYSMKDTEDVGLVKFDFLGLKTLTIIDWAVRYAKQIDGVDIDLSTLPFDDPATMAMVAEGKTTALFQFESQGMKEALALVRADRIEDLIAVTALYRPGPMENIPVYADCKHGREKPEYYHPKLEPVLKETFGVIIYQEQVMQAAQILSGYSLGEADMLRRAMGKKIKAEMDAQRDRFVEGAVERDVPRAKANEIFDLLAKFADYGFNKSHAAAYALISYQTAYLKRHHPACFFASALFYAEKPEAKQVLRKDMDLFGIEMLPPDINVSVARFWPERLADGGIAVRFGLMGISGITPQAGDRMVERRGDRPFVNLIDFHERAGSLFNSNQLLSMAVLGAFDKINPGGNRQQSYEILQFLSKNAPKDKGMDDMFGGNAKTAIRKDVLETEEWTNIEARMFDAAGFHVISHPLDRHADILARIGVRTRKQFDEMAKTGGVTDSVHGYLHALVQDAVLKSNDRGPYVSVRLSEKSDTYDVNVYPTRRKVGPGVATAKDILDLAKSAKRESKPVIVTVKASLGRQGDRVFLNGSEMASLDPFIDEMAEPTRYVIPYELEKCHVAGIMGYSQKKTEIDGKFDAGVGINHCAGEMMSFYVKMASKNFIMMEEQLKKLVDKKEITLTTPEKSSVIQFVFTVQVKDRLVDINFEPFKDFYFRRNVLIMDTLRHLTGVDNVKQEDRYEQGYRAFAANLAGQRQDARERRVDPVREERRDHQGDAFPNFRKSRTALTMVASSDERRDEEPAPFSLH